MLNFQQAIELAKATICKNCVCTDCKQCPWTAERAIEEVKQAVNE